MGQNPLNLAFRFLLEILALLAVGYWGWVEHTGLLRILLAVGLPVLAAVLWATFRVPGDASASGRAPVAVPGWLRLLLELGLFAAATWALFGAGAATAATIFGLAVVVHYAISYDRVLWLLRQ
ncbi:MAG: YrdB family protein [Caldilineae bacterium]|nr:YrdB family protein [Anaerolineae bacterium]MCB9152557.1 YrdB family protein [Caldilineae bacterium]